MEVTSDQKELTRLQRQEFDDLQNEIAGRETGRQARFLRDGPGSEIAKKKEREAQRALTRMAQLLNDPVYRAKYGSVLQVLSDSEQATEAAIDQLTKQITDAQTEIDEMKSNAARLPGGTRVFRDADGVVRREDGTTVDDHLADTIIWTGNEPSFEDVQDAKQRLDDLQTALDDVNGYQNGVLGPARDKITDPDNPPSLGELDAVLDNIKTGMPDAVKVQIAETVPAPQPEVDPLSVALPSLSSKP